MFKRAIVISRDTWTSGKKDGRRNGLKAILAFEFGPYGESEENILPEQVGEPQQIEGYFSKRTVRTPKKGTRSCKDKEFVTRLCLFCKLQCTCLGRCGKIAGGKLS
jgi:hypothetical protein